MSGRQVGVKVDRVKKVYETRGEPILALDECSLDLEPGEFVSVVGPSGCGKSTLLLMVAGLIPTSSGTITIGERPVIGPYTDLGIVFQEPVLLDWRKVLGQRAAPGRAPPRARQARLPRSGRSSCSRSSASTASRTATRTSSPAACGSASRSAGRCSTTRRCC